MAEENLKSHPEGTPPSGEDDAKPQDAGIGEEGKGEEPKADEKPEERKEPTPEELLAQKDQEIIELRQLLREQRKELDALKSRLDKTAQTMKEAGIAPEEDEEQAKQRELAELRRAHLETILEAMRVNPKYEDVDEVVSQAHFDDMVEAMAEAYVEKYGGDIRSVAAEIENWIWSLPNPYKFMYEQIKKYHPDYAPKQEPAGSPAPTPREPAQAPTSVAGIGGGASGRGGWTAKMIDELPEDELHKVPKDIYELYLQGKLK